MIFSTCSRLAISSRWVRPQYSACWMKLERIFRLRPVMMLSSTLMPLNSAMFWKVRAMPWRAASCGRILLRASPR